jgi:hypothetical protein
LAGAPLRYAELSELLYVNKARETFLLKKTNVSIEKRIFTDSASGQA